MGSAVIRDQFAEMYVAGVLADAGWNIYLPHRDVGFDMIATFANGDDIAIRPVQVKGLYPTAEKTGKAVYGYVGKLSALHPEMVLCLVYFPTSLSRSPRHIAWMPRPAIKQTSRGYRCQPARYDDEGPSPRPKFECFFDDAGLAALSSECFAVSAG